jgi:hypothetical protein
MIPVDWQFLGSLSFDFGSNREAFIPFTFTERFVGVRATINQLNAKQTWIKAGYLTQVIPSTNIGQNTTTVSRLIRFEPQIVEFPDANSYQLKFRPVPWIVSINLEFFAGLVGLPNSDLAQLVEDEINQATEEQGAISAAIKRYLLQTNAKIDTLTDAVEATDLLIIGD